MTDEVKPGDVLEEWATYLEGIDVSRKPTMDLPNPEVAATILWQAGIHSTDLEAALDAVARCRSYTGWSVTKCARFIATAAAIGHITGPSLLVLPRLAQVAIE